MEIKAKSVSLVVTMRGCRKETLWKRGGFPMSTEETMKERCDVG